MFIFSIKLSKLLKRVALGVVAVVLVISVCSTGLKLFGKGEEKQEEKNKENISVNTSVNGESTNSKIQFLNEKGIKVKGEAQGVIEVLVPNEFNENYEAYNTLQKKQGFDLSKKKGKELKQWTYMIDTKNKKEIYYVNLLMEKDTVVGCDVTHGKDNTKMSIADFLNEQ